MRAKLKEDPKEWRKSTLLTVLALAVISSILCWRRVLPVTGWRLTLMILVLVGLTAFFRPPWFRAYYRVSTRCGFWLSLMIARIVLAVLFLLIIVPLGLLFRLMGKDGLHLKRVSGQDSYWTEAKPTSPLDRLF
ncbi:MAG TPA: hypothetical protein VL361_24135 [Candidatus Limnocylindrales bacterium]|jgi:hypothetical protein|nr:hypothetical protein [Candidatus Limnocylindrales bacterium]